MMSLAVGAKKGVKTIVGQRRVSKSHVCNARVPGSQTDAYDVIQKTFAFLKRIFVKLIKRSSGQRDWDASRREWNDLEVQWTNCMSHRHRAAAVAGCQPPWLMMAAKRVNPLTVAHRTIFYFSIPFSVAFKYKSSLKIKWPIKMLKK